MDCTKFHGRRITCIEKEYWKSCKKLSKIAYNAKTIRDGILFGYINVIHYIRQRKYLSSHELSDILTDLVIGQTGKVWMHTTQNLEWISKTENVVTK